MEHAVPVLRAFLDIFPERPILAVGQLCQRTLASLNITALAVRHPSYGGATEFRKHVHALRDELRAN
jgi:hypothetical protein